MNMIRYGIVGCGSMGREHILTIKASYSPGALNECPAFGARSLSRAWAGTQ